MCIRDSHRLPERGTQFLTDLFNSCLRLAYFPVKWKTATVIVIPKPGKNSSRVENLRPISLLSATSKVFERLIPVSYTHLDVYKRQYSESKLFFKRVCRPKYICFKENILSLVSFLDEKIRSFF